MQLFKEHSALIFKLLLVLIFINACKRTYFSPEFSIQAVPEAKGKIKVIIYNEAHLKGYYFGNSEKTTIISFMGYYIYRSPDPFAAPYQLIGIDSHKNFNIDNPPPSYSVYLTERQEIRDSATVTDSNSSANPAVFIDNCESGKTYSYHVSEIWNDYIWQSGTTWKWKEPVGVQSYTEESNSSSAVCP